MSSFLQTSNFENCFENIHREILKFLPAEVLYQQSQKVDLTQIWEELKVRMRQLTSFSQGCRGRRQAALTKPPKTQM